MNKKCISIVFCLLLLPIFGLGQGCKMYSYDQWKVKFSFCVPTNWTIDEFFIGYVLFMPPDINLPGKRGWGVRLDAINRPDLKSADECHKWYLVNPIERPATQRQYTDIKASTPVEFKTDSGLTGTKSVITYTEPDYMPEHVIYGFQIDDIVQCYVFQTLQSDLDGFKSVDTALKTLKLVKKTPPHGK
jgi:hypothetical protein